MCFFALPQVWAGGEDETKGKAVKIGAAEDEKLAAIEFVDLSK